MSSLIGDLGSTVQSTFRRMEIAEEEISKAKAGASPEEAARVHEAFKELAPGPALHPLSDDVYRAHARELCLRARAGGDLLEPTEAECLAVLMATSGVAPLTADGAALAERLFRNVMLCEVPGAVGPGAQESWPGACDELLIGLKRTARAARSR
jgi:hypothetical protein